MATLPGRLFAVGVQNEANSASIADWNVRSSTGRRKRTIEGNTSPHGWAGVARCCQALQGPVTVSVQRSAHENLTRNIHPPGKLALFLEITAPGTLGYSSQHANFAQNNGRRAIQFLLSLLMSSLAAHRLPIVTNRTQYNAMSLPTVSQLTPLFLSDFYVRSVGVSQHGLMMYGTYSSYTGGCVSTLHHVLPLSMKLVSEDGICDTRTRTTEFDSG